MKLRINNMKSKITIFFAFENVPQVGGEKAPIYTLRDISAAHTQPKIQKKF